MNHTTLRKRLSEIIVVLFSVLLVVPAMWGQIPEIKRIEPLHWWTGLKNPELQIVLYGKNLALCSLSIDYPGIQLQRIVKTDNPNYIFMYLHISPETKPGNLAITLHSGKQSRVIPYQLFPKSSATNRIQGLHGADVMYMLMPDRFANGDPTNDRLSGMPDITHRDSLHARHGGDLKGIIERLDYIKNLGCTAIWATPLLENNMPQYSYHGYAITDFYAIDARFGSNNLYREYVEKAHTKGLKVVMDMVLNHCGSRHWFIQDPPTQDWAHYLPDFRKSSDWKKDYPRGSYRASTLSDPAASEFDKKVMSESWFDYTMPDLNQKNPLLATYLMQNALWWVEFAGLDGIRVDTYPYPDKHFSAAWTQYLLREYPQLYIVGEVWINDVTMSAYWQGNRRNADGYTSNLPAITDFPVNYALNAVFNEQESWDTGMNKLYHTIANDFVYENPAKNLIFLDNHDLNRFFSSVGEDPKKLKMALTALFTLRGIPQMYYGTELATAGWKNPDPLVRKDFPGGWSSDTVNTFTEKGLTAVQQEIFRFVQSLARWRATKEVFRSGKFMHFVPHNGLYTYFRYSERECVMIVLNNNSTGEMTIPLERYQERLQGKVRAKNVGTGEIIDNISTVRIPAKSALILEIGQ